MRLIVAAALLLGAAAPAAAQQADSRVLIPGEGQGTLTFYQRPNFRGQATTFRSGDPDVNLPFYPGSIRAEGSWQLCPETRFRGRCVYANSSYRTAEDLGLRFNVRSLVPERPGGPGGGPVPPLPGPGGNAGGPTLRGMASQFYSEPMYGRQRVVACASGAGSALCAKQTADRFCRDANWRTARSFEQQTLGRRAYLADVLCSNRQF